MKNTQKILGTALILACLAVMLIGVCVDRTSAASASASFGKIKTVYVEKSANGNLYITASYAIYDTPAVCKLVSYGSKSFSGTYELYSVKKNKNGVYKIPRQKVVSGRSYAVRITYDHRSCVTPKIKIGPAESYQVGHKKTVYRN